MFSTKIYEETTSNKYGVNAHIIINTNSISRLIGFLFVLIIMRNNSFCQQVVGAGQMPSMVTERNLVHLVYGRQDSIMYSVSEDFGKTFTKETVVAVIPDLAASHTRGPQIAVNTQGVVITACNAPGDIYSFVLDSRKNVIAKSRVNDADTTAKENLMALSAHGDMVFATWLDLRSGHNQIYGAGSSDGGRTWSKNVRIYSSPDTTVCECCKPSVEVHGTNVYVMFRNWLNGYRDLYVVRSNDRGNSFDIPQKVGYGGWKLSGCPMDGGDFTVFAHDAVHAVFNRAGSIFACTLGEQEKQIGSGRSCTMDAFEARAAYAWVEKGNIVCLNSLGRKILLGQGQVPILKVIDSSHALCVWESEKQIMKTIVAL
jgi:hypothetical protein